jgi:hypothetical protein
MDSIHAAALALQSFSSELARSELMHLSKQNLSPGTY